MKVNVSLEAVPAVTQGPLKEMLSVSTRRGKKLIRINNSSLDLIQTCFRKAGYYLHQGIRGGGGSPALTYGSALHAALEAFYLTPREERVFRKNCKESFELIGHSGVPKERHEDCPMCATAVAFWESAREIRGLDFHNARSVSAGIWTLYNYYLKYINDPFSVFEFEGKPFVEGVFSHEIYEDSEMIIEIFGTIDLVLQNEQTGSIIVADHKTASRMGNQFLNRIKPNNQYTYYMLGVIKELGIPAKQFMVNGIEVKAIPKTTRGTVPNFVRQFTNRDEGDFQELKDSVKYYVDAYLGCIDEGFFPAGTVNSCAMYSGCQFLDVCSSPSSVRNVILQSKLEI